MADTLVDNSTLSQPTCQSMSFQELLERWSELEPDRCSHVAGIFVLRGWSISFDTEVADRLTVSEVQNAVQEAIEQHEWNWFLGRIKIEKATYYKARISIPNAPDAFNKNLTTRLSTCSAAYALLDAYLHTLEILSKQDIVIPQDEELEEEIDAASLAEEAELIPT